ncbi:hypothetical protein IFO69_01115 [Echinicola sp. CAU 1574]|uniref:Peptidase M48 domain-containing protein n=1 Tax=Echinicola arenosa TaxID=2774144 RepID=A0ABR9AGC7_9BACT|nr:hypothetical protein [Echinicola arenosa]MBD8487337.1 hypothetical protein [Echinicola arenosa]
MFNFLKSNKKYEPLNWELRKYFENNFLWLLQEFPKPKIEDRKILTPTSEHFPIKWNKSKDNAFDAHRIICENMQIDPSKVELDFFDNGLKEIDMGTSMIFVESDPENPEAAGLFHHEKEDGKYSVSLDEALLAKPDHLIATIAHELAHVKLLGVKKLNQNDEMLTDFTTVFFGLGIFNANSAFQFYNQSDRWGYSNLGYLKTDEWAYALALFAFIRQEDDPEWKQYLSKTIKKDFDKCLRYMIDNEEEVFKFDD